MYIVTKPQKDYTHLGAILHIFLVIFSDAPTSRVVKTGMCIANASGMTMPNSSNSAG